MSTRIPPLLEPYLSLPPEASLIVLTSILGASTNWLVIRYLHTLLNHRSNPDFESDDGSRPRTVGEDEDDDVSVLLVSFLRDYPFWRDGAGRQGVDLDAAGRKGKFAFVDGLTGICLPTPPAEKGSPWRARLDSHGLEDVSRALHGAVDGLAARGAGKVVLVVDQLDLLLATAGLEEEEGLGGKLREMVLDLREVCAMPPITFPYRAGIVYQHVNRKHMLRS